MMIDVVGKSLDEAKQLLIKNGYENIEVVRTNSDKQKFFDTEIVIRQKIVNNYIQLVVTNVLINI